MLSFPPFRLSAKLVPSLGLLVTAGFAAAPVTDKSIYSWANSTPDNLLRELATDRPDATESPFTVDAGHVQIELDLVNYTHNRLDGMRTTEWGVLPFNLRVGIRHNFEVGIFVTPYVRITEQVRDGPMMSESGAGDTTLRAKWNFAGNDGGDSAVGLIVDLKLPTAKRSLGNDKVEGGLTLPVAFDLPQGWSLGAMSGLSAMHNGTSYRALWTNTATVAHDLLENVDGYVELTSASGDGPHVCTLNLGVSWRVDKNQQVDAGVNVGISRSAPDLTFFTGFSRRF
jgi:hypothetical protein